VVARFDNFLTESFEQNSRQSLDRAVQHFGFYKYVVDEHAFD